MRAKISNVDIAAMFEVQHTTVSRWRSGDRVPSLGTMLRIATEFNWDMTAQAVSVQGGNYHESFEKVLIGLYGEEEDDGQPASEEAPA